MATALPVLVPGALDAGVGVTLDAAAPLTLPTRSSDSDAEGAGGFVSMTSIQL
jgi:hypothetical protein